MSRSPLRKMSGLDDEEFDRQKELAEDFLRRSGLLVSMICQYDDEMSASIAEAAESYDTLVSIFDPTMYMQHQEQLKTNGRMVAIIVNAKKKLTELGLCLGQ